MAPNIFEFTVWNLLYATLLAPKILNPVLDFWETLCIRAEGMPVAFTCALFGVCLVYETFILRRHCGELYLVMTGCVAGSQWR
jgi:hypothetical protein